ncbi:MAG: type II toxin-antitoxin system death-on-curing family toxin [Henriciella sp.]|jgi:death-on-curing protein|uniref:type II toxin-antitoxin system death-on-curing family toxin n=1 Tax=Henriciella sp. TaxID=1968823 RepID=UPI000C0DC568|nr:type II toxin-antitoxin system death-on-curing family toxin [Henriciella sp.]MAN73230.1 type II toxin-antitoxin system death-on-curing family toxin [Henriciella sp.]MBF34568.1 type II toxin-antitoxin system death-on-curing family toxin [Hyphomonadaceae bacterium]PHR74936.1 MAG: type II toxin-antitoxin system death-on-curing family toxin [Henriciella sp.]|tara:strand:- start:974 stop:1360 length:387 start_codon:yes stop_codon:yes gene_type:complete
MSEPRWLDKSFILRVHDRQLELHGGARGLRDEGLLDSALARALNAYGYGESDTCMLGALYGAGIIQNHPFVDGNKRTGYVACLTFLRANGFSLTAPMAERLAWTLMLAAGEIGHAEYADWLRANALPV